MWRESSKDRGCNSRAFFWPLSRRSGRVPTLPYPPLGSMATLGTRLGACVVKNPKLRTIQQCRSASDRPRHRKRAPKGSSRAVTTRLPRGRIHLRMPPPLYNKWGNLKFCIWPGRFRTNRVIHEFRIRFSDRLLESLLRREEITPTSPTAEEMYP